MKISSILLVVVILLLSVETKSQNRQPELISDKEEAEFVTTKFLQCAADNKLNDFSSSLVDKQSLREFREFILSMFNDSSVVMGIVSVDSLKLMTPEQLYDYVMFTWNKFFNTELNPKPEWEITSTQLEDELAIVSYRVEGKEEKEMRLKKNEGKWKLVLSNNSIF